MLMVIFGAGASYDSFARHSPESKMYPEDRPPLAIELFDDRPAFAKILRLFPDCQSVASDLRHRDPKQGVEQVLERLQSESVNDPIGQREMAAVRYYLQKIIWDCEMRWEERHNGATNYRSLLRLIRIHNKEPGPVCFVTFNYDTLLEKALPALDLHIGTIRDYIKNDRYKLFKVHGSVNWMRVLSPPCDLAEIASPDMHEWLIHHANIVFTGEPLPDDFELVADISSGKLLHEDHRGMEREYALFPAIAIPVENKVQFEMPSDHLGLLKKLMPSVTKLLVIGWRATDIPFLELLSKASAARVHIVCESEEKGDEVREKLLHGGVNPKEFYANYRGFTDFVIGGKAETF
jgi:hypothetical protein